MSPRLFTFALLFIAAARAGAQQALVPDAAPAAPLNPTPSEPTIALDALIARALANNPQPQIAAANYEAARARAQSARASLGPTLQIVPGVFGNANSRDEEIILSQPLDLFGQRRAGRAVFDAQVRRAEAERDLATRSLVVSVKNAAADLFAAQEAESLGQFQLDIAGQFREAAARRAQLGDVPPVQVQRAQLELDRAAIELDGARAARLSRRALLNQLIGQAPETPLRVALPDLEAQPFGGLPNAAFGASAAGLSDPAPGLAGAGATPNVPSVAPDANAPVSPPAPVLGALPRTPIVGASSQVGSDLVASRASLLPGALQRPDVVAAQSSAEAARAQVTAIARQRRPLLEIQARRGGVFDPSPVSLRAVFTIPLFDVGANRNQQRAAEFEAQAQEKRVELLRSQVAAQVESALVTLQRNRALVTRYRESLVPQTLDLLRKTQLGYAQGASTYLEVLEAQRAARQIQTEYLQALVGVRGGEAALESALGSTYTGTLGPLANPGSLDAPPGVAAPGTIPDDTIPPNVVAPLDPTGAPPTDTLPGAPLPGAPAEASEEK